MSALALAARDSVTMLRRQLRHMTRAWSVTLMLLAVPIVFLLLFVYVLGGTLGDGLGVGSGGRGAYVDYVAPGILLVTIAGAVQGTAISVAVDMTGGIIARFRTMAIARVSVLTGHVLGSVLHTLFSLVVVLGVALLVGFRPTATAVGRLAAAGVLTATTFALVWTAVAMGLVTKSVAAASNLPMPLTLLPFFGSGFVPTDSLPAGLRWFAEHQPITPITETLRGLLLGTPIGDRAAIALGWCAVIVLIGYAWAKRLYNRDRTR
ncbi:ABC-2 type transport system permease protein [Saccharothrix saharensis]|uniref:Transport permease protein n=1 Tax=Saccharothrix saharensis TaxID=571190 RepID=A0A543J747_9PSEU|nr:ABC transporter permease [Saccharothrix saharensis]TQM78651.1 ABC-2 type transport system permease protein [Saccharothrix saharensis]